MAIRPTLSFLPYFAFFLAGLLTAGCGHTKRSPVLPPLDKLGSLKIRYDVEVKRKTGSGFATDSTRTSIARGYFFEGGSPSTWPSASCS